MARWIVKERILDHALPPVRTWVVVDQDGSFAGDIRHADEAAASFLCNALNRAETAEATLSRLDEATKECVPGVGLEERIRMMVEDYRRRSDRSELEAELEAAQDRCRELEGGIRRIVRKIEGVDRDTNFGDDFEAGVDDAVNDLCSLIRQAGNEEGK